MHGSSQSIECLDDEDGSTPLFILYVLVDGELSSSWPFHSFSGGVRAMLSAVGELLSGDYTSALCNLIRTSNGIHLDIRRAYGASWLDVLLVGCFDNGLRNFGPQFMPIRADEFRAGIRSLVKGIEAIHPPMVLNGSTIPGEVTPWCSARYTATSRRWGDKWHDMEEEHLFRFFEAECCEQVRSCGDVVIARCPDDSFYISGRWSYLEPGEGCEMDMCELSGALDHLWQRYSKVKSATGNSLELMRESITGAEEVFWRVCASQAKILGLMRQRSLSESDLVSKAGITYLELKSLDEVPWTRSLVIERLAFALNVLPGELLIEASGDECTALNAETFLTRVVGANLISESPGYLSEVERWEVELHDRAIEYAHWMANPHRGKRTKRKWLSVKRVAFWKIDQLISEAAQVGIVFVLKQHVRFNVDSIDASGHISYPYAVNELAIRTQRLSEAERDALLSARLSQR
jgi:DNA-binding Xre family transcriptional regulator